jgi:hypothetical protein
MINVEVNFRLPSPTTETGVIKPFFDLLPLRSREVSASQTRSPRFALGRYLVLVRQAVFALTVDALFSIAKDPFATNLIDSFSVCFRILPVVFANMLWVMPLARGSPLSRPGTLM